MSEQFQNSIEESLKYASSIFLTHIYMTAHFPGLVQVLQYQFTTDLLQWENILRVTYEWHYFINLYLYDKYGYDSFRPIELLVACKEAW